MFYRSIDYFIRFCHDKTSSIPIYSLFRRIDVSIKFNILLKMVNWLCDAIEIFTHCRRKLMKLLTFGLSHWNYLVKSEKAHGFSVSFFVFCLSVVILLLPFVFGALISWIFRFVSMFFCFHLSFWLSLLLCCLYHCDCSIRVSYIPLKFYIHFHLYGKCRRFF